jgi:hypothetical protein
MAAAFYLSVDCPECDEEVMWGPVATTIEYEGLPVLPFDMAGQTSFTCPDPDCGTTFYTGDFDLFTDD